MGDDGWDSGPESVPVSQTFYSSNRQSGGRQQNRGFQRDDQGSGSGFQREERGFGFRNNDDRGSHNEERRSGFGFGRDEGGFGDRPRRGGRQNRDGGYRENRRENGDSGGNWRSNDVEATTMTINSDFVGKIIGKGGSKIRELQDQSGARIKVSNDDETGDGKVVLMGSTEAQEKAKALIEEVLDGAMSGGGQLAFLHTPSKFDQNEEIDWDALNDRYETAQKERWAKCPPLVKNFYHEHPDISSMSEREVKEFREASNNISVAHVFGETSEPVPKPVKTFEHAFADYPEILEEIKKQGFAAPSPIQCQAWPVLLQGKDLIGISQTGSGKTLAFLLPALIHIEGQPVPRSERGGANVLILAPTRELALQIDKEVKKYSYRGIKCICVYGGGSRKEQHNILTAGVEIIIATPGRLNDFVQAGIIDVSAVTYLVLDEADRMLDMGFEPQIRKVLLDIRPDRQTVMTSATWPEGVRRLAQSYMKDPLQVYIGTLDLAACHSVTQVIRIISEEDKVDMLRDFIDSMAPEDKVIVFVGKKLKADDIASELAVSGISAQCLHGNREQCDREQALEDIKSGEVRILIATDVASRGLDIEDITHILNFDFPRNIDDYVHRVGRTGRAGRTGTAISFVTRSDWGSAKELIDILEEANQEVPEELLDMKNRFDAMKERRAQERESFGGGGGGGGGRFGGGGGGGRFGGGGGGGRFDGGGGGGRFGGGGGGGGGGRRGGGGGRFGGGGRWD